MGAHLVPGPGLSASRLGQQSSRHAPGILLCYRDGTGSTERYTDLPKSAQLEGNGARPQTAGPLSLERFCSSRIILPDA